MNKEIIDLTVKLICMAGNSKNFNSGEEKKQWCLNRLREEMKYDEKIEDIIINMIDWMILIDKKTIIINPYVKKNCLSCFK